MNQPKNILYLIKLWVLPTIIILMFALSIVNATKEGSNIIFTYIIPILIVVVLFFLIRVYFNKKVVALLQNPSPEPYINYVNKNMSNVPDAKYQVAFATGLIYIFYGEFNLAQQQLNSLDWQNKPPLIFSQALVLEALLNYFDNKDYNKGYQLALKAKELSTIPGVFPGSNTSKQAYNSYVLIGEILNGEFTEETIKNLELSFNTLPILGKLLSAWGLTIAYRKILDNSKGQIYSNFIQNTAPYCKSLLSF